MADDSEYLFKEGCESCGSSDANAVYTDGHKFCFACEKYTPGDGEGEAVSQPRARRVPSDLIQGGEFQALPSRRIREDTCQKFGYRIAERGGHKVPRVARAGHPGVRAVLQRRW